MPPPARSFHSHLGIYLFSLFFFVHTYIYCCWFVWIGIIFYILLCNSPFYLTYFELLSLILLLPHSFDDLHDTLSYRLFSIFQHFKELCEYRFAFVVNVSSYFLRIHYDVYFKKHLIHISKTPSRKTFLLCLLMAYENDFFFILWSILFLRFSLCWFSKPKLWSVVLICISDY